MSVDKSPAWSLSDLSTYDWPTDSDILSIISLQAQIIWILTHQKIKNMNDSFGFY